AEDDVGSPEAGQVGRPIAAVELVPGAAGAVGDDHRPLAAAPLELRVRLAAGSGGGDRIDLLAGRIGGQAFAEVELGALLVGGVDEPGGAEVLLAAAGRGERRDGDQQR